jgi:hypothetical protein
MPNKFIQPTGSKLMPFSTLYGPAADDGVIPYDNSCDKLALL